MSSDKTQIGLDALDRLVRLALQRAGMSEANAAPIAKGIVSCERDAVKSHGLLRLDGFVTSLRLGWADGKAEPKVLSETPSLLCVDAGSGFVQVVLDRFREQLMARARDTGIAVLQIRNSHHFSALWPDLEPFATEGLAAFACVNSKKRMAAWSGGHAVLGTNAMAFAVPRKDVLPMIWDQSSSVMSQGDILHAARRGHEVPIGVGVDSNGEPTTNPAAILDGGALLPFGGPKGASLAVMVEILAAGLSGGEFGFQDASPGQTATTSRGGYFLLLVDPSKSTPDFLERMELFYSALAETGSKRLPGERRYAARKVSLEEGVWLEADMFAKLLELAGEA
jgi:delta1-piperideine-2-carboxylate reductase